MEAEFKKTIKYNTLLKYSVRHFGSKIKVARKSHIKKDEEAVAVFKKNFSQSCKEISQHYQQKYKSINLYFQGESLFSLFTKNGGAITAKGVKPIRPFQQVFQSLYLFGAFSAITSDYFMLEIPNCNAACFQIFLHEFSKQNPEECKAMVLDNGAFYKAKCLTIPKNIALIFLPPYSPELNPAEKMWAKLKRTVTNRLFNSLDMLIEFICEITKNIERETVRKLCIQLNFSKSFLDYIVSHYGITY